MSMNMKSWKTWAVLGVVGAAVAVPLLRKRMGHGSTNSDHIGSADYNSAEFTSGGMAAPASDTWAQSQTP
jgi:hypothetical protein